MKRATPFVLSLAALVLATLVVRRYFADAEVTPEEPRPAALESEPAPSRSVRMMSEQSRLSAGETALATAAPARSARVSVPAGEPDASLGPEPVLIVAVSTRIYPVSVSTPVPSVPVAVGVGAPLDPGEPALATAVTDAEGLARLEVPWSVIEAARNTPGAEVWARVTGPGFQHWTGRRPLPEAPGVLALALAARPGGTLRGRLLAGPNRPVSGKLRMLSRPRPGLLPRGGRGIAGSDGWFEVHLKTEGTYDVFGVAGAHGTAAIGDHDVRFTGDVAPIELVTRGPGVVRGRVRDPAGRPSATLAVVVLLAALDDERGSLVLPQPQGYERRLEGRGRLSVEVITDADGAFEARGLRADSYVVRARTDSSRSYPILLTPAPVPSDGARLELAFGRPHLVVRIVNEDGSRWSKPVAVGVPRQLNPPREWPAKPRLIVVQESDGVHLFSPRTAFVRGRRGVDGAYVFEVEDDRRYLVGLLGGAMPWRPVAVSRPAGTSRIEVTVVVPKAAPTGALLVAVHDAKGAAVESEPAIRLEDLDTGTPLLVRDSFYRVTWPVRFELPEGQYRLVVEGAAFIDDQHGTMLTERAHGRFTTTIQILDGRETTVNAVLPRGARLKVRLAGSASAADREAVLASDLYLSEEWAGKASIALIADSRWPEPVWFRWEWTGTSAAGTHLTSELDLGSEQTSELLPAGRFRIEARLPGGRVVSRSVVLVDGETTEVDLSFE